MPKRKDKDEEEIQNKELIAEDWCFICKDGGELLICDKPQCLKAYHPKCVGKNDSVFTSNKRWICKWHSCLVCRKASEFRCYCCPNAVCRRCYHKANFECVNKNKYGFCNGCLKLALLIEENMDIDSDGENVDLKDRETYEGLFKEYYEIIREQEGFDADTVRQAKIQLDLDDTDRSLSEFDEIKEDEEEVCLSSGSDENPFDSGGQKVGQRSKKLKIQKTNSKKKETSKKLVFDSWGSEALMRFLKLIDVDTKEELSPDDVERVILRYVKENKLFHPTKKRKVICDAKLLSILRRKEVNKNSIPRILECHFAMNQEESSEDDEICEDIEDEDEKTVATYEVEGKQKSDNDKQTSDNEKQTSDNDRQMLDNDKQKSDNEKQKSDYDKQKPDNDKQKSGKDKQKSDNDKQKSDKDKQKSDNDKQKSGKDIVKKERLANIPQSRYAAIVPENIKHIYLKRSLVLELSKQPQAFENKVVGSFVRVKSNPNVRRSLFQLEQVTGIRSVPVAEENSEVLLRVSNMPNDICLSMLSDGDFSEEECQLLLQKVKTGLMKKSILVELQEKARILHEDITKHWIPRELARLENLSNIANEKGWRRELYEYLSRKKDLQDPAYVSKLLQKIPEVIPDTEAPDTPPEDINNERKENGTSQESPPEDINNERKENGTSQESPPPIVPADHSKTGQPLQSTANKELNGLKPCQQEELQKQSHNLSSVDQLECALPDNGKPDQQTDVNLETEKIAMATVMELVGNINSGVNDESLNQPMDVKLDADNSQEQTMAEAIEVGADEKSKDGEKQNQVVKVKVETEKSDKSRMDDATEHNVDEKAEAGTENPEALVWHISGMNKQDEKYNLSFLKSWSESNGEALKFKVWKEGQSEDNDAIPLKDAVKLAFPRLTS